jgi:RHS repeat-associated protein
MKSFVQLRLGGWTGLVLAGLAVLAASLLPASPSLASDTVYYYSSDSLHSEVVITDQNRNVVERTHYAPYGQVLDRSLRDGPGYTGHAEDPGTGLVYMQQRYYDPEAGRFLSSDPVPADGNGGSFNRYWYAKDNPYRYTDPDGRDVTEFIGGLFVETAHFVTGQGFNGSAVAGALVDGYNGEGGGVGHALLEDANTAFDALGAAGAIKGAAALVGRVAVEQAVKEGAELGAKKGLTTPGRFFGNKTAKEASDALGKKLGPARSSRPGADTFHNPKTGRSYNVHTDPKHGPPHVDIRTRGKIPDQKIPLKKDVD